MLELTTERKMLCERLKDVREKWYGIHEGRDGVILPWNHGSVVDPTMEANFLAVDRMKGAIEYIKKRLADGETAIAVDHGVILGMYARSIFPETSFHFENCSVVKLISDGDRVEFAGNYCPIKGMK